MATHPVAVNAERNAHQLVSPSDITDRKAVGRTFVTVVGQFVGVVEYRPPWEGGRRRPRVREPRVATRAQG